MPVIQFADANGQIFYFDMDGDGTSSAPFRAKSVIHAGTVDATLQNDIGIKEGGFPSDAAVMVNGAAYTAKVGQGGTGQVITSSDATGGVALTSGTPATAYLWIEALTISVGAPMTVFIEDESGTVLAKYHMAANQTVREVGSTEDWASPNIGEELRVRTSVAGDIAVRIATVERTTAPA